MPVDAYLVFSLHMFRPRLLKFDFRSLHKGASINYVDKQGGGRVSQMSTILHKIRYIVNLSTKSCLVYEKFQKKLES